MGQKTLNAKPDNNHNDDDEDRSRYLVAGQQIQYFRHRQRLYLLAVFLMGFYPVSTDDIVITVSGHSSKHGWVERVLQRLREQLEPRGVELNREKTQVVDTLKGEAFGFLGFDLRGVPKSDGNGYFLLISPKKKARKAIKAKIRGISAVWVQRPLRSWCSGSTPCWLAGSTTPGSATPAAPSAR